MHVSDTLSTTDIKTPWLNKDGTTLNIGGAVHHVNGLIISNNKCISCYNNSTISNGSDAVCVECLAICVRNQSSNNIYRDRLVEASSEITKLKKMLLS